MRRNVNYGNLFVRKCSCVKTKGNSITVFFYTLLERFVYGNSPLQNNIINIFEN